MNYNRSWFTLVELMIVMVVIGILSVALFPQITSYLARGRDTERTAGIKQISVAVTAYQVKNQVLPIWTGSNDKCVNQDILKGFYFQRFPVDPVGTKNHWWCDILWLYGYGTGKILAVNKAAFSVFFENPNGWNTWSIDEYQWNTVSVGSMNEIKFMQKWTGSGYVSTN